MKAFRSNGLSQSVARLAAVSLLFLVSCDDEFNPCDNICQWEAECFSGCDDPESPICDPEENARRILRDCLAGCDNAAISGTGCVDAIGPWEDCINTMQCGAMPTDLCRVNETRYYEMCHYTPGEWVCGYFCEHLAIGCMSWEKFGYRGNNCVETCRQSAQDFACREAHYSYLLCTGPTALACELETEACGDAEATLNSACEAWQPADPIPAEDAACAPIAQRQCDCGFYIAEENCVELAANRCRYEFGRGQVCIDAINAFDLCMISIPNCKRDILAEQCLNEWNAWSDACMY